MTYFLFNLQLGEKEVKYCQRNIFESILVKEKEKLTLQVGKTEMSQVHDSRANMLIK